MMDEEIRQALTEVQEMKKMCGNINMKLTNIVTQRGQDWKAKLEAEYQRGFEEGKALSDKGCAGCEYAGKIVTGPPCITCSNSYRNLWTAKQTDDEIKVGDEVVALDECMMVMSDLLPWIVTSEGINYYRGIDMNGESRSREKGRVRKTGRHFDIASILEAMKK